MVGIGDGICAENHLVIEPLQSSVVAVQSEDFADDTPARLASHMDDEINGLSNLGFDVCKRCLGVAAKNEICKAAKRLRGRVGMDGGKRTTRSSWSQVRLRYEFQLR
jgi:hypothetical protein